MSFSFDLTYLLLVSFAVYPFFYQFMD